MIVTMRNLLSLSTKILPQFRPAIRVSSNSKYVFVPSGFSVSHVSLLIATPQKSRSSRLSDDQEVRRIHSEMSRQLFTSLCHRTNFTWRIEFGLVKLRDERQAHHGRT
jgi:hypothetical protein